MKLIVAIVHDSDSVKLMAALVDAGFQVTKLATSGGFLRAGNTTLMIGTEESRVDELLDLIKQNCEAREEILSPAMPIGNSDAFVTMPIEVKVGGATVFVLPVEQFLKY